MFNVLHDYVETKCIVNDDLIKMFKKLNNNWQKEAEMQCSRKVSTQFWPNLIHLTTCH